MEKKIYLDNASTTMPSKNVIDEVVKAMSENYGNPSSAHTMGIEAEHKLKESRERVQSLCKKHWSKIYFTSGGTESNNWALISGSNKNKHVGKTIITSSVEHPSVLEPLKELEKRGFKIVKISVDDKCHIDMDEFEKHMKEDVALISIMRVNNETGSIFPVEELYKLKPEHAIFHSDCIQALGKVDIPKVDLVSFSGHKLHGPKGVGALCLGNNIKMPPMIVGGGQEENMRSGTENLQSIAGFGKACEEALNKYEDNKKYIGALKERLKLAIQENLDDIKINSPENSVSNILNVSFIGTKSEVLLHRLEMEGIFVSAGSACSTNKKSQSHVLKAMGLKDEEVDSAIRFSFSRYNTEEEIDYVAEKLIESVRGMRSIMRFRGRR